MKLNFELVAPQLRQFLNEDLKTGDLTAPVIPNTRVDGHFILKQPAVVSGVELPAMFYSLLSDQVTYKPLISDGTAAEAGTILGRVSGNARDLLAAERVTLNLMQRMCGIASATAQAVSALDNSHVGILDTRKTAPGLRLFDKYAVICGGGVNHRLGLYDAVMLKDNHWQLMGSLKEAVATLRQTAGPTKIIEVEVETEDELHAAIENNVDMILIDNQPPATVKAWRQQIPQRIVVEASGGIQLENLAEYGQTGVDFISLGYLTNSVQAKDISFELDAE
ncbi:carboxylating nicotinate-nucleotide diphosphorylase [Secundilactobacillus yichangensis]|uniref:carboxylating nicotinate-nucleotide diphosphorylase n=1 Tax=Secundilactobacillus yichangensis TaxID=2799580 RepID=UPI001F16E294|nr:carboxylating nicotinate-nucleotide diphosphorylase [Secundilactobacillus yichangensis]